jgi:hypothetical protein
MFSRQHPPSSLLSFSFASIPIANPVQRVSQLVADTTHQDIAIGIAKLVVVRSWPI